MRRLFLFVFILCFSQLTFAQRHELGIFAGGANVIGDVGKASYINPFPTKTEPGGKIYLPISIGALYRFNINPQMAANAAKILKRVKNIPFKEASFSLLLQDFAKKRTYAPVNPKLNKLK